MFGKDNIKFRMPYSIPQIPVFHLSSEKDIEKVESTIAKTIDKLIKQNINIIVCQRYLDSMVNKYFITNLNKLERVNALSMERIQNAFLRRASDQKEFQVLLDRINVEIISTKKDLEMVIDLYNHSNPLHNGKLNISNVFDLYQIKTEESNDE